LRRTFKIFRILSVSASSNTSFSYAGRGSALQRKGFSLALISFSIYSMKVSQSSSTITNYITVFELKINGNILFALINQIISKFSQKSNKSFLFIVPIVVCNYKIEKLITFKNLNLWLNLHLNRILQHFIPRYI
jgi:hypothetical protein